MAQQRRIVVHLNDRAHSARLALRRHLRLSEVGWGTIRWPLQQQTSNTVQGAGFVCRAIRQAAENERATMPN